jgi:hypothetical protein
MDSTRSVTVAVLVAVTLFGPLAPRALAQQPAPSSQPDAVNDMTLEYGQEPRRMDAYDVGAAVVTAVRAPLNVASCVVGGAVSTALFFLTLGNAYKASTRVLEEGCAQKWVVRGTDLRPRGTSSVVDRPMGVDGDVRR